MDSYFRSFLAFPTAFLKRWADAYLAAFAVAGGLPFVTLDAAYRSFPGLDVKILQLS